MADFEQHAHASLDSMLENLREELRAELGLALVSDKLLFMRFPEKFFDRAHQEEGNPL